MRTTFARTVTAAARASTSGPTAAAALRRTKFTLPELSYEYSALEPVISGEIMEIHHSKHHNTYVTNLNGAYDQLGEAQATGDVSASIALQGAIKVSAAEFPRDPPRVLELVLAMDPRTARAKLAAP